MQIKQLIESLRIEETKDHVIIYDLEPHMQRLYNSIQELNFELPPVILSEASGSQNQAGDNGILTSPLAPQDDTEFILFFHTQIKAKAQYQFNKGVAFFDSRFNIDGESISLKQRSPNSKIHKLRLIYNLHGSFEIETEEYTRDLKKDWQVKILSPEEFQINSQEQQWKHKFYPRPSLRGGTTKQSDEIIWTNEKNQICEGSFTNIFFQDSQGQWHTPHLDCNILPGVMRTKLIKELSAEEGFYTKLPAKVLLVNSLFCKLTSDY